MKFASVSDPRSAAVNWPSHPGVCVSRCQIATVFVVVSSCTLKSGRYRFTGALRSTFPCSTSRIIAVVVTVLEIDASAKTVSGVIG